MTDLTALSDSQLREGAAAYAAEARRREAMDETARHEAFMGRVQEVRDGTRALADEYIPYLSPREVETTVNRGQVPGIAPDKRLSRHR